eukprot:1870878-Prymnesium_polylepis.1
MCTRDKKHPARFPPKYTKDGKLDDKWRSCIIPGQVGCLHAPTCGLCAPPHARHVRPVRATPRRECCIFALHSALAVHSAHVARVSSPWH